MMPQIPKLVGTYQRQWLKCRTCGRVMYYDYLPYSLSTPIMTTSCGHGIADRDLGCDNITADEALAILSDPEYREKHVVKPRSPHLHRPQTLEQVQQRVADIARFAEKGEFVRAQEEEHRLHHDVLHSIAFCNIEGEGHAPQACAREAYETWRLQFPRG